MTPRAFDPLDRATWPDVLSIEEVALIYRRSAEGIRHSLKPSARRVAFSPRPFLGRPLRWRKADVMRDLDGQRSVPSLRRLA